MTYTYNYGGTPPMKNYSVIYRGSGSRSGLFTVAVPGESADKAAQAFLTESRYKAMCGAAIHKEVIAAPNETILVLGPNADYETAVYAYTATRPTGVIATPSEAPAALAFAATTAAAARA